jgi:hypothetical protein
MTGPEWIPTRMASGCLELGALILRTARCIANAMSATDVACAA